ncbi:hypothetical protein PROFUN_12952 [Planoprotostelium fungivorum]|uniref:Carboxylic ester hydrolase n=1 Tax=Planoprotostelium fungivorum TaxID=1890364 RepID=A0A2P6N5X6_9EUKA|nr:hypothetical protein PROFUN_12952 [Planoprotostelium fungivorum]
MRSSSSPRLDKVVATAYDVKEGLKWASADFSTTLQFTTLIPPKGKIIKHLWVQAVAMTDLQSATKLMAAPGNADPSEDSRVVLTLADGSRRLYFEGSGGYGSHFHTHPMNCRYGHIKHRWADPSPCFSQDGNARIHHATDSIRIITEDRPLSTRTNLPGVADEDCLRLNIFVPPQSSTSQISLQRHPVGVYIHGGFLQFGHPHICNVDHLITDIDEERYKVWVVPTYRLGVLGFLAGTKNIRGNFGLNDLWFCLQWIQKNIITFGGDPTEVCISGTSAGAYACHQLMHRLSRSSASSTPLFREARLYSNAIVNQPQDMQRSRQNILRIFHHLGGQGHDDEDIEALLRGISTGDLLAAVEHLQLVFRPTTDDVIIQEQMTWQRSGRLGHQLYERGFRRLVLGEVRDEHSFYSILHRVEDQSQLVEVLRRYYPDDVVRVLMENIPRKVMEDVSTALGWAMSHAQVFVPIRMLTRDLWDTPVQVLRYRIEWSPNRSDIIGHGSDLSLWTCTHSVRKRENQEVCRNWHASVRQKPKEIEDVLLLDHTGHIQWTRDERWKDCLSLSKDIEKRHKISRL